MGQSNGSVCPHVHTPHDGAPIASSDYVPDWHCQSGNNFRQANWHTPTIWTSEKHICTIHLEQQLNAEKERTALRNTLGE